MIRSSLLMFGGNVAVSLLQLARNILIARLISVENYGIAVTFAVTMAMIEMTSHLAFDRLIVQAKDGAAPRLQGVLHALQLLRGVLTASVLFLAAGPIAAWFGVPELVWAYQVIALIPLMRGFGHLDMYRAQREMRFRASVTVEFTAQAFATVAALALALALDDYRAMLYSLVLQHMAFIAMSHAVAKRPYRLAWDTGDMRRAAHFGWPLLINSFLMFGIFNGDRMIVANQIGLRELGLFSAAFTLTLLPTLVLAKSIHTFFLPQLARVQHLPNELARLFRVATQASILVGVTLALVFALIGPQLFLTLFGHKFDAALALLVWLAIMQAARVAKSGPSTTALAMAETRNPMIANIFRVLMLPVAFILVQEGADILAVVWVALVGEAIALAVALFLLNRRLSLRTVPLLPTLAAAAMTLGLIGLDVHLYPPQPNIFAHMHGLQLVLIASFMLLVVAMRDLRAWVSELVRDRSIVAQVPRPAE